MLIKEAMWAENVGQWLNSCVACLTLAELQHQAGEEGLSMVVHEI